MTSNFLVIAQMRLTFFLNHYKWCYSNLITAYMANTLPVVALLFLGLMFSSYSMSSRLCNYKF
jgi:hypothetical protein